MQVNPNVTIERKRVDCNALPKGWQREEILRKSGIAAGKVDVYYYSPTGKKIESKPQLSRQLGDTFDISSFDFTTGKMIEHHIPLPSLYRCSLSSQSASSDDIGTVIGVAGISHNVSGSTNVLKRKYKTQPSVGGGNDNMSSSAGTSAATNLRQQIEFSRALRTDVSLVPPIRQTASIFKQPVTVVRNHGSNKVKHDTKHGSQEKPKQLFWEKRLERLRACHDTGEELGDITLPKTIRSVGPNVNEQTVLQSLATALHVLNTGVHGQTSTKAELTKNAMAFLNPEQPLMHAVLISEDDIRKQEDRVNVCRKKLQDALKS